ncbi:MAG: hypothetical protein GOMPHAMPRED_000874 [Gomphillus americanus]|uniref:Uncharacterized protein n=1 Tax=Gomphillus americanus TaxID=1940652 RepID=A0A8H3ICN5_9LECA|nr:MAG: hypothetical protein GOMPHAMPRED_000874 [Gomphillus americanus]
MNGAALFFLLLLLLIILPVGGWIGYTRWRAHKHGLPPPPLSAYNPFKRSISNPFADSHRSGPIGWVKDKFSGLRGASSSGGAYHGAAHSRLDPDGAWDDRVGDEADRFGPGAGYEEQELGLHPSTPGHYGGSGYGQALAQYGEERGRARSRDNGFIGGNQEGLDQRYDEEVHGATSNPFGNAAERSDLRGISPRPIEDRPNHAHKTSKDSTGERKSVFHETL